MTENKPVSNLADIKREEQLFEGAAMKIEDVLNKPLIVKAFKNLPSTFKESKEYAVIQAELEGKLVFFTGSPVLLKQLQRYEKHIPFKTTIVRTKQYYELT